MEQIPDDPRIREAENCGMPPYDDPDPVCPICGEVCETIYTSDIDGSVVGCDECLTLWEADTWTEEHKEVHEK